MSKMNQLSRAKKGEGPADLHKSLTLELVVFSEILGCNLIEPVETAVETETNHDTCFTRISYH